MATRLHHHRSRGLLIVSNNQRRRFTIARVSKEELPRPTGGYSRPEKALQVWQNGTAQPSQGISLTNDRAVEALAALTNVGYDDEPTVVFGQRPSGGSRVDTITASAANGVSLTDDMGGPSSELVNRPSGGSSRRPSTPETTNKEAEEASGVKAWLEKGKASMASLKELGLGALASYGFVSNVFYVPMTTIAWIAFVKKYGVSPIAQGQWPVFMAFFAGLFAFGNVVRPLRFTAAMALTPIFNKLLGMIQSRFGLSKRNAFGAYLLCMGTLSTVGMLGGISLAVGFPTPRVLV